MKAMRVILLTFSLLSFPAVGADLFEPIPRPECRFDYGPCPNGVGNCWNLVRNDCGIDCPTPRTVPGPNDYKIVRYWCPLPLPGKVCDLKKLADAACRYANQVKKCYNKDRVTAVEKEWLDDRPSRIQACRQAVTSGSGVRIPGKDFTLQFCETVYKEHLKPCSECQFGNCGEGSEVNFCQAYFAGCAKKQYICQTITHVVQMPDGTKVPDGHAFAIIESPDGTRCVLDRWQLSSDYGDPSFLPDSWRNGGTDEKMCRGTFFCDKNLRLEKGTLCWGTGDKSKCSDQAWYQKLTCRNPDTGDTFE